MRYPIQNFPKWSYSQLGEDTIMAELLRDCPPRKYLDIGCNDPKFFSNTFHFYEDKGWRGIAVDAIDFKDDWNRDRPEDTFIHTLVGRGKHRFLEIEPKGLSSVVWRKEYLKATQDGTMNIQVTKSTLMKARPISDFMTADTQLLSIDVEGMDYDVLLTNDWKEFKPYVVCIETWESMKRFRDFRPDLFLSQFGYEMVAFTGLNTIFARKEVYDAWKQIGRLDYFNVI